MLKKLNSKIFFCLCILVLPLILSGIEIPAEEPEAIDDVPEASKLKFAAWNIRNFGPKKEVKEGEINRVEYIEKILSQYDFIAITELMEQETEDPEGEKFPEFVETLNLLSKNGDYKYMISPVVGKGVYNQDERYVFLYKKDRVHCVEGGQIYEDIFRDAYYATFRAGKFDFTVIVVHIHYGDGTSAPRKQNKKLGELYRTVQKSKDDENDILLVGDFNMEPSDESFNALLTGSFKVTPLFEFDRESKTGDVSNFADTPRLYDNIFFENDEVREYLSSKVDQFHKTYFQGNKDAAKVVSDHRPLSAVFRTDLDDDPSDYTSEEGCKEAIHHKPTEPQ